MPTSTDEVERVKKERDRRAGGFGAGEVYVYCASTLAGRVRCCCWPLDGLWKLLLLKICGRVTMSPNTRNRVGPARGLSSRAPLDWKIAAATRIWAPCKSDVGM